MSLSDATNTARETLVAFSGNVWFQWCLVTCSERQVVLMLEALADLVEVDLQAVLRVGAVKEFQEPLHLVVDFFCAPRGVFPRPRPVRRPHPHFRN